MSPFSRETWNSHLILQTMAGFLSLGRSNRCNISHNIVQHCCELLRHVAFGAGQTNATCYVATMATMGSQTSATSAVFFVLGLETMLAPDSFQFCKWDRNGCRSVASSQSSAVPKLRALRETNFSLTVDHGDTQWVSHLYKCLISLFPGVVIFTNDVP